MADEEDFDIDIYGDDKAEFVFEPADKQPKNGEKKGDKGLGQGGEKTIPLTSQLEPETEIPNNKQEPTPPDLLNVNQTQQEQDNNITNPKNDQPIKEIKNDIIMDNDIDMNATTAVRFNELQWWTTEDDVRGWANKAGIESEIKELTFNEHKVNGKSKGEIFVSLQSRQAASSLMKYINVFNEGQTSSTKKIQAFYVTSEPNPFKSFPKDAQTRNRDWQQQQQQSTPNNSFNNQQNGNFRGRGGNMMNGTNRGGFNQHSNTNNNNNNNTGFINNNGRGGGMMNNNMSRGGFQQNGGGFRGGRGGNMNSMGVNNNNNNNNFGGMMNNMAALAGMTGLPMGMNMGMNMPMNGGMNMGNMGFNAGYPQNQFNMQGSQQISPGGNPHGVKRPRAE